MSTVEILNGLQDYLTLLSIVKEHLISDQIVKGQLAKKVTQSYSFITLELELKDDDSKRLYFECKFEIQNDGVTLSSLYCQERSKENDLKQFIEHQAPIGRFPSTTNFNNYHPDVLKYFALADEIAKTGVSCSPGDSYRPGHYSEIIVEEERVALRQINWHNAKSSAHKDNYHMRELEFFIPLKGQKPKPSFDSESIGDMIINFRDNSSNQNKSCGDKIRVKIEEERGKFERSTMK